MRSPGASAALPRNYVPRAILDLTTQRTTAGVLLLALLLTGPAAWGVERLLPMVRSDWSSLAEILLQIQATLPLLNSELSLVLGFSAAFSVLLMLFTLAHELIHALCFWLFTAVPPILGSVRGYLYCGLPPGRFLPRNQYLVVILAPLFALSGIGVALLAHLPLVLVPPLALVLVVHTAAASGDVWVAGWLLSRSSTEHVWDAGATTIIYGQSRSFL